MRRIFQKHALYYPTCARRPRFLYLIIHTACVLSPSPLLSSRTRTISTSNCITIRNSSSYASRPMEPSTLRLRKSSQHLPHSRVPSIHWLFRTNIPRRRSSFLPPEIQKRNFFGMGEIVGVLTNVCSSSRFRHGLITVHPTSQQKLSVRSRNPNDSWMKLDVRFRKTKNGHSFVPNTPFLGSLDFSLGKQRFKPSSGHWKVNLLSLFFSEQVLRERYGISPSQGLVS